MCYGFPGRVLRVARIFPCARLPRVSPKPSPRAQRRSGKPVGSFFPYGRIIFISSHWDLFFRSLLEMANDGGGSYPGRQIDRSTEHYCIQGRIAPLIMAAVLFFVFVDRAEHSIPFPCRGCVVGVNYYDSATTMNRSIITPAKMLNHSMEGHGLIWPCRHPYGQAD
jgi:hypothetical protein